MQSPSIRILSQIIAYSKYQRFNPTLGRKETWDETISRNKAMHSKKYQEAIQREPTLQTEIDRAYQLVAEHKILPSMRSMQFAGIPIDKQEARIYNCCYLPITDVISFKEAIYLLLCGTGVGYSVQHHHVAALPPVNHPTGQYRHVIGDSVEGWADAIDALISSYLSTDPAVREPVFDGSAVRPAGTVIASIQAPAPGPEPLMRSLDQVREILRLNKPGERLKPIDVMDIINILSECALAGGVRRSAMICLFSPTDSAMLTAKSGNWHQTYPWRSRTNNSAVIYRQDPNARDQFTNLWKTLSEARSGEPGVYFTNDRELNWGTNPCVETALRPYQFCNLTEINASTITSQEDFNERATYAALLGTMQAGYTKFNYLSERWQISTERDALLGIGLTGIAHGCIKNLSEGEAVQCAMVANERIAKILGINVAARVTCVKPSGTTSSLLGCASGIHAIHSPYYIRRVRISKLDPIYGYLVREVPDLIEDEVWNKQTTAVLSIPIEFDDPHAAYRDESAITFLERVKRYNRNWVMPGHRSGVNYHNVSATVSIRDGEWAPVGSWLWENRDSYTGIACFPMDNTQYKQTPFEECDKDTFERLGSKMRPLCFDDILSTTDIDADSSACAGGSCEV